MDEERKWSTWESMVCSMLDEKECYDNGCNPLTLKWVDKISQNLQRSHACPTSTPHARDNMICTSTEVKARRKGLRCYQVYGMEIKIYNACITRRCDHDDGDTNKFVGNT